MGKTLNLLFSQPPAGIGDEEYNAWYEAHVPEILSIPGFVGARRYRIAQAPESPGEPVAFSYLAVFEIETDFETAMQAMQDASLGSYEQYKALRAANPDGPAIPEWFPDIEFHWWVGEQVGPDFTADAG